MSEEITKEEMDKIWGEIPSYAWVALARRGMDKISLDQCFLEGCDNQDMGQLVPFKIEKSKEGENDIKHIHIKCKKCGGIFQFKIEDIKRVAKPTKKGKDGKDDDSEVLSMGVIYALDENGKNLGHIGYY